MSLLIGIGCEVAHHNTTKNSLLRVLQLARVDLHVIVINSAHLQCLVLSCTSVRTLRLACPSLRCDTYRQPSRKLHRLILSKQMQPTPHRSLVFNSNHQAREMVLEDCPSLVTLFVEDCSRLMNLVLPSRASASGGLERLVLHIPLKRICLPDGSRLRLLSISGSSWKTIEGLASASFRLAIFSAVTAVNLQLPANVACSKQTQEGEQEDEPMLWWHAPNLLTLDLTGNKMAENNAVRLSAPRLQTLRCEHSLVGDEFFERIEPLPCLDRASLVECNGITGKGLLRLLAKAPRLVKLDISLCSRVTTADIVRMGQWATKHKSGGVSGDPSQATLKSVRLAQCPLVDEGEAQRQIGKVFKLSFSTKTKSNLF